MEQARGKKLRRLLKSFLSILLCCFLITAYSYKKPVKADAAMTATATITGALVIAGVFSALGIGISAKHDNVSYVQECSNIWNRISENTRMQIALTGLNVSNGLAKVVLTQQFIREAFDQIRSAWPQVSESTVSGPFTSSQFQSVTNLSSSLANYVYGSIVSLSHGSDISYCGDMTIPSVADTGLTYSLPITGLVITSQSPTHFTDFNDESNNVTLSTSWYISGSAMSNSFASIASANTYLNNINFWYQYNCLIFPSASNWSMYTAVYGGTTYLYLTAKSICDGVTYMCRIDGDPGAIPIFGQDLFNPAIDSLFAEGDSVMVNPVDDVIGDIAGRVGNPDGTIPISVPVSGDVAGDRDIADQQTRTQSDTLGRDIATDADKTADTDYNDKQDKDTTLPKSASMPSMLLPTGLAKKFPFCLPWDLAACYRLFQVSPKAPVWTIPINIDQGALHLHKTYTYDLNGNNVMDTCLPVFKWFLNIGFIIALIILTKKIMS